MRQYIDACATFTAYEEASTQAAQLRGGMYWHKGPPAAPDNSYLVRTSTTGGEKSLGPRSAETERIYHAFLERKDTARTRLAALKDALAKHRRLNRALHVGRVRTYHCRSAEPARFRQPGGTLPRRWNACAVCLRGRCRFPLRGRRTGDQGHRLAVGCQEACRVRHCATPHR